MPFIEEVEQAERKAQVRKAIPIVALAVAAVVLAAALFLMQGVLGGSDFVLSSEGETVEAGPDEAGDDDAGDTASAVEGIYVYVSGAVVSPGVYTLPDTARVTDAITAAGGFGEKADTEALNLAQALTDGERVDVPTKAETKAAEAAAGASSADTGSSASSRSTSSSTSTGKVNINTAGLEELKTLSGIGDVTAQKIIDYREANGAFAAIEDIKNVSGIADKRFEAIADYICV